MTEPEPDRVASLGKRRAARTENVRAVVLAGGKGTRLAPYTSVLPKPLMPIGDRAILEIVLEQLRSNGIGDVTLSVGYLSHLIEAVLGDGSSYDVSLRYVREVQALGTAAPLRLVNDLASTFVVMNGDVLTTLDYRALIAHHREHGNTVTIAAQKRPLKIDYGVLEVSENGNGPRVDRFVEKPQVDSIVSIGVYVMEPKVRDHIPATGHFDFPDLVHALLAAGEPVGVFEHNGLWFDIGRHEDYEQAVEVWMAAERGTEVEPGLEQLVRDAGAHTA
jgi:NDP-sugar pyrophosphorylase family protein